MDWAKATATRDEKQFSFWGFGVAYVRGFTMMIDNGLWNVL